MDIEKSLTWWYIVLHAVHIPLHLSFVHANWVCDRLLHIRSETRLGQEADTPGVCLDERRDPPHGPRRLQDGTD